MSNTNVIVESRNDWFTSLLWVVIPVVVFGVSFFEGGFLEGPFMVASFLIYVALVILLGILASRASFSRHPFLFLHKISVRRGFIPVVVLILLSTFFFLGFLMEMSDIPSGSLHTQSQKISLSLDSGLEFSTLFFLIPFLAGYLPTTAIHISRRYSQSQ